MKMITTRISQLKSRGIKHKTISLLTASKKIMLSQIEIIECKRKIHLNQIRGDKNLKWLKMMA